MAGNRARQHYKCKGISVEMVFPKGSIMSRGFLQRQMQWDKCPLDKQLLYLKNNAL